MALHCSFLGFEDPEPWAAKLQLRAPQAPLAHPKLKAQRTQQLAIELLWHTLAASRKPKVKKLTTEPSSPSRGSRTLWILYKKMQKVVLWHFVAHSIFIWCYRSRLCSALVVNSVFPTCRTLGGLNLSFSCVHSERSCTKSSAGTIPLKTFTPIQPICFWGGQVQKSLQKAQARINDIMNWFGSIRSSITSWRRADPGRSRAGHIAVTNTCSSSIFDVAPICDLAILYIWQEMVRVQN